jgi:hypothetical protein
MLIIHLKNLYFATYYIYRDDIYLYSLPCISKGECTSAAIIQQITNTPVASQQRQRLRSDEDLL